MKYLILTLSTFLTVSTGMIAQTVYSDDQVIKLSDYIYELEHKDSALKAEMASIDQSMLLLENEPATPEFISVCGKITGLNKNQFPITDINLQLVKENGEIVTQKTANNGHFMFPNIKTTENYSFKLDETETKIIKADKIIISDCNGKTISTISKNALGFFEYKALEADKVQLNMADGDLNPVMKLKKLKENYKKTQEDLAIAKGCKSNYDALKEEYDEVLKNYNDLKLAKSKLPSTDTDENLKNPTQLKKYLKNIQFKTNDANLDDVAKQSLDNAVAQLNKFKTIKFRIEGYADNMGTDSINKIISLERANVVKSYLVSKGVKEARLKAEGLGSAFPIATNETKDGKAQNRRVEIKAVK
jgi:outer membrane protein OmpA-like peptidoglycan-associated protein